MSASNTIARRTYTRREKHRIAKDISRLLRGDLFAKFINRAQRIVPVVLKTRDIQRSTRGHARFVLSVKTKSHWHSFYMDDPHY